MRPAAHPDALIARYESVYRCLAPDDVRPEARIGALKAIRTHPDRGDDEAA